MEDNLTEFLEKNRARVSEEYIHFVKNEAGSKYTQDDIEVIRPRINYFLDSFISTIKNHDNSIFLNYADTTARARIASGYDPNSVIRVFDWALDWFVNLVETELAADPLKAIYVRRLQFAIGSGKLAVVKNNLSKFTQKASPQ